MQKSMSASKKVIKIKPPEFFKQDEIPTDDDTQSKEVELHELQQKVQETAQHLEILKKQQTELLTSTKTEIEREKDNWVREKAEWIEQAKEEGYSAGFTTGKEESFDQYKGLIEQANSIIQRANQDYHATLEKSDETILNLAIYTAEKILTQKLADEPKLFLSIVHAAIKELQDQSIITIYLHPANFEFVVEQKEELTRSLGDEMKLSIYIKDDLDENACLIEHPFGQIDASIDTQLKQIHEILQDVAQENKQ
ncbi:flagellar assembly protein FliH [Oceanobacillus salinisoli]|uniref:flagellar assembly protein FliH n=1 Tax=Oceanobacillus salinisoli TaxID=2678611 RepID=UPI001E29B230|nr:flagellar assembly protein FliH [Oceanobacillus salinisoli]